MPPQHLEGWLWKQGAKGLVKGYGDSLHFNFMHYTSNLTPIGVSVSPLSCFSMYYNIHDINSCLCRWKNRWFAMPNDSEIHYYQSNTSLESLGMFSIVTADFNIQIFSLQHLTHLFHCNFHSYSTGYIDMRIITSVVAEPTKKKDAKGFLFYITTPARVYHLAASTEKELNYW